MYYFLMTTSLISVLISKEIMSKQAKLFKSLHKAILEMVDKDYSSSKNVL